MFNKMCYMINRTNKDKLNLNKKQQNQRLLHRNDLEEYDYDFFNMMSWTHYPNFCYVTIIDDRIVSCASAGYHENKVSDRIVDISTKTHKDYRGKGHSVANVVALCEYILNMKEEKEIHYITDTKNIASQKTALSAGLMKVRYSYILFRKLKAKLVGRAKIL